MGAEQPAIAVAEVDAPCRIDVETQSDLTRGHTAVEFRVEAATARHFWATKADADGVFALIAERLGAGQ